MQRWELLGALGVGLVLALIGVVGYVAVSNQPDGLPQPDEIESMRVMVYSQSTEEKWHDVPRDHFAPILAALRPRHRDRHALKWQVFGESDLTLRGGKHVSIWLFSTTKGESGAFAAGRTWETRVYYRGGTDEGIKAAIRAACPPQDF